MLGYVTAAGKSLEMPTILLTGEALNTFQKVVSKNVELSANVVKKQSSWNKSTPILKEGGYYHSNGMKISEEYYDKLWKVRRPAPFIQAREILNSNPKVLPDERGKVGCYRYEANDLEMIYNSITKDIWHIQPIKR